MSRAADGQRVQGVDMRHVVNLHPRGPTATTIVSRDGALSRAAAERGDPYGFLSMSRFGSA